MIYGPSLRCNGGVSCDAPVKRTQGCVYISGLSVDHRCVRALMKYARVLLISTTALVGPTFCPGSERAGCPSGVITDRPRCTPWCESSWCDAALLSSSRPFLHLDGL